MEEERLKMKQEASTITTLNIDDARHAEEKSSTQTQQQPHSNPFYQAFINQDFLQSIDGQDRVVMDEILSHENPFVAGRELERKYLRSMKFEQDGQLHFSTIKTSHLRTLTDDQRGTCKYCWLLTQHCICKQLQQVVIPHKLLLVFHYKEYRRASSTGKLLMSSIPNSEAFLFLHKQSMEQLVTRIQNEHDRTCILFPSATSFTFEEFVDQINSLKPLSQTNDSTTQTASGKAIPPLNIIILDGTWRQANTMFKFLINACETKSQSVPPKLPYVVKLLPQTLSRFVARQQTRPDRICTLEAFALFLSEMGLPEPCWQPLHDNLQVAMEALMLQSHCSTKTNHKRWKKLGIRGPDEEQEEEED